MSNNDDFMRSTTKRNYPFGARLPRNVKLDPRVLNDGTYGFFIVHVDGDWQVWAFEKEHDRDKWVKRYEKCGGEVYAKLPGFFVQSDPSHGYPCPPPTDYPIDPDCDVFAFGGKFPWDRK
jgi:hypothetical protein